MIIIFSIILGFFASIISALFGGGSGLILVPGIYWILAHSNPVYDTYLMQTTLATCFLLSVPIGFISSIKQYHYGNIEKKTFIKFFPFIITGVLIGLVTILFIKTSVLKIYFSIMVFSVALWMYFRKPDDTLNYTNKILKPFFSKLVALLVGFISVTIGVSVFIVPFFIKMGINIKRAIATSTVVVFFNSIMSSIILVLIGLNLNNLPDGNYGLINLPIFLSCFIPTILGSYIGTKLAHVLSQDKLKLIFIIMMITVSIIMIIPS